MASEARYSWPFVVLMYTLLLYCSTLQTLEFSMILSDGIFSKSASIIRAKLGTTEYCLPKPVMLKSSNLKLSQLVVQNKSKKIKLSIPLKLTK